MSVLISVIVPVYNVERFLPRCINTILNQTYKNLELIIVDDGSTDKSGEIADQFEKKYENVICIHKENGGLSDARNCGLEHAKGEYVVFVDSDDWVEHNMIEDNLLLLQEKNVDVIVWGYYADFVDENETVINSIEVSCNDVLCKRSYNPEVLLEENVLGLSGYAWNKMYSMSLLKQGKFRFHKGLSLVEDIVFNVPVLIAADRVYFNSSKYTHYMQRGRETLGKKYYDDFLELKILACDKRQELLISFGVDKKQVEDILWGNYFYAHISTIRMINRQATITKDEKIEIIKLIVDSWLESPKSAKVKSKEMDVILLSMLFYFRLYKTILRILK